jgi:vacuolar-type H+-ATPase subunit H
MQAQAEFTAPVLVDEAIARVLSAEQSARTAVESFAAEAERLRDGARVRARAIAERGAERAATVHRRTDAAIRRRIAQLNAERQALSRSTEADAREPARLAHALERLVADLVEGTE